jgi:hypothetical protein
MIPEVREHLENPDTYETTILKWMFKECDVPLWIKLMWCIIESCGEFMPTWMWTS